jgi:DNA polymerase III epsilon subunit-like protein
MTYVFFDVECANCLHGEGKICSLGYVKTDERFQPLKKKDILINPDGPFLLGNAKKGQGIRLAYPLFRFRWAHTFPTYYETLKSLLTAKDTLVFGFAVNQDVSYLSYSCRRYNLEPIRFRYFDIQGFEKNLHHRKNPTGLDSLVDFYNVKRFTYHRSDDDAFMTMEVFRSLLENEKLSVSQALALAPNSFNDTDTLLKQMAARKEQRQKKEAHRREEENFFRGFKDRKPVLEAYDHFFWKRSFFFEGKIFARDLSYLIRHQDTLCAKGGTVVRSPQDADVLVRYDKKEELRYPSLKPKVISLSFAEFRGHLESQKKPRHNEKAGV